MAYQDKLQHLGIMKWFLLSVKAVVFFVSLVKNCIFFFSLTRPCFLLLTVKNYNLFLHLQIDIFQGLCLKLLLQLSFSDVYLFLKGIQAVISPLE